MNAIADSESKQDSRRGRRQKVLKAGKIVLHGNLSVVDCTIRDISDTGAKLSTINAVAIPAEFKLVVLADNIMRDVKVAWRKEAILGVKFTSEAKRAPPRKW